MSSPPSFSFELCATTLEACAAANAGGAQRIELCTALDVDGLTPPLSLVQAAIEAGSVPVHVLLRPRATSFLSPAEVEIVAASIRAMGGIGVAGVVLGSLGKDHRVDVKTIRALVQMAGSMEVTFHRAFDETPDIYAALEDVIDAGCARVLTSGGAPDVQRGAGTLARLVQQAGGRIQVALGGGLRVENALQVARSTGARHFHGSLRKHGADPSAADVRQMVNLLRSEAATTSQMPNAHVCLQ